MTTHRFISMAELPWIEARQTHESPLDYKDHFHQELFVGAVIYGTTRVTFPQKSVLATPGTLVVMPPGEVHRCTPQEGVRSYWVALIDPNWFLSLQQSLFGYADHLMVPETPLITDPSLFSRFCHLIGLLKGPGTALDSSEQLTLFSVELLKKSAQPTQKPLPEQSRFIDRAKERLADALEENLTLAELAEYVGYNPYYLLRSFKNEVGLTPHEFRLNLRIEKAKELLRNGHPPAAVAAETGFVDQSHFHRTFRQFVAATPRQFQLRG